MQPVVEFDNIALANGGGDNFDHVEPQVFCAIRASDRCCASFNPKRGKRQGQVAFFSKWGAVSAAFSAFDGSTPFWHQETYARRRPLLLRRAKLKRALQFWFDTRDFLEVETGIVQVSPGNETHLHAFKTHWQRMDGETRHAFLHTSPEFAMKKLLAAGEKRIYQFAPVFRGRESSPLHSAEFTMLEWYRAGEEYAALRHDCRALLALAAQVFERSIWHFGDKTCDSLALPEQLSACEAFARHANLDLEAVLTDRDAFAAAAQAIGVRVTPEDGWSDIFSRVLSEKIEPKLGIGRPVFLERYPLSEAALARPCPQDPRFAERFELYICGVEIANAFGELTDTATQRLRFETDMTEKARLYGHTYPLDEDFLQALAQMPQASGSALGFDRLVMLAAGEQAVETIRFTPFTHTAEE